MFEFDMPALEALCPPDGLIERPGGNRSNFLPIGTFYVSKWVEAGLVKPDSWVYDLGCSTGRMAIPLTQVLTGKQASYLGVDIVKSSVDWCDKMIGPKFPHFDFEHFDVRSTYYNNTGAIDPAVAEFPDIRNSEGAYDFLFATSVFTHMGRKDAFENYMQQIALLLRPGGKAFLTFFLLDRAGGPGAKHTFHHTVSPREVAVFQGGDYDSVSAYGLDYIMSVAGKVGMPLNTYEKGSWALPGNAVEPYQDLLTFQKV